MMVKFLSICRMWSYFKPSYKGDEVVVYQKKYKDLNKFVSSNGNVYLPVDQTGDPLVEFSYLTPAL